MTPKRPITGYVKAAVTRALKAISVRQPFATLLVRGVKRYEARTWETPYRGLLAIHASKQMAPGLAALLAAREFRRALEAAGLEPTLPALHALPRRALIGTAFLDRIDYVEEAPVITARDLLLVGAVDEQTLLWRLTSAREAPPLPLDGALNLWPVPERLAAELVAARRRRTPPARPRGRRP